LRIVNDYWNFFIEVYIRIVLAMSCQKIRVLLNVTSRRPPVNPTLRLYLKVRWMLTLLYPGSPGRR